MKRALVKVCVDNRYINGKTVRVGVELRLLGILLYSKQEKFSPCSDQVASAVGEQIVSHLNEALAH